LRWVYEQYTRVAALAPEVDALFVFHVANTFAAEVRRALFDLGRPIPLVGYTHGSHWDPTDTYRTEHYPGMAFSDLGNLLALDTVFVVSDYMREVLVDNVTSLNPSVGEDLNQRLRVAPLPIDHARIDAACALAQRQNDDRLTLVFNHSSSSAKGPQVLAKALPELLDDFPELVCHFTRAVPWDSVGEPVRRLVAHYPGRVILHGDLPVSAYFDLLVRSDLQVSCATHESFGVATVEAMYAGCCCIVPRIGVFPSLMAATPEALYDGTAHGLAARLRAFLSSSTDRAATAGAQRHAAAEYTGERAASVIACEVVALMGSRSSAA
jgi:glycosyltransferase involved in cell wall biosynthesis